ncbi:MAG: glycosyltransferase family 2 protein [Anaerolineae bacterium]|nr:glycosyltransferase family 2 protein [Anaerolineae bacterium]
MTTVSNQMCDLSIVIVNWNTPEYLDACLRTVADEIALLGSVRVETFVVDNASADHSVAMLKERYGWVTLIENSENVGFACANNQAVRLAQGRYILLLNSDTEIEPGALAILIAFLNQHPEAGAVGARLLNSDGSLQISAHPAPTLARELWYLLHLDRLHPWAIYPMPAWPVDQPQRVEILKGACILLRHTVLDEIGLLDEDFFMYSEEVDLCKRVEQAGWELYWEPRAVIIHHGGRSTQQVPLAMFMHLYRSKVLYFRKRHGLPAALVYKIILAFAALGRVAVAALAWLERPPRREQHRELGRRYYQLLKALPSM